MFIVVNGEIRELTLDELRNVKGRIKLVDLDGRCLMKGVDRSIVVWKIFGLNGGDLNGEKEKRR